MRSVGGLSATSLKECSTAERHLKVVERCVPCHGILLLYFPPTQSVTTVQICPTPPMRKITHQKERCTPVEPPRNKSERGCGSHLHTNGSLSKVKEQMIGALCLGAVLQKIELMFWKCGTGWARLWMATQTVLFFSPSWPFNYVPSPCQRHTHKSGHRGAGWIRHTVPMARGIENT